MTWWGRVVRYRGDMAVVIGRDDAIVWLWTGATSGSWAMWGQIVQAKPSECQVTATTRACLPWDLN